MSSNSQQPVVAYSQNYFVQQEVEHQIERHVNVASQSAYRIANHISALREGGSLKDRQRALDMAIEDFHVELRALKGMLKFEQDNVIAPPNVRQRFFRWFSRTFLGMTDV